MRAFAKGNCRAIKSLAPLNLMPSIYVIKYRYKITLFYAKLGSLSNHFN